MGASGTAGSCQERGVRWVRSQAKRWWEQRTLDVGPSSLLLGQVGGLGERVGGKGIS